MWSRPAPYRPVTRGVRASCNSAKGARVHKNCSLCAVCGFLCVHVCKGAPLVHAVVEYHTFRYLGISLLEFSTLRRIFLLNVRMRTDFMVAEAKLALVGLFFFSFFLYTDSSLKLIRSELTAVYSHFS